MAVLLKTFFLLLVLPFVLPAVPAFYHQVLCLDRFIPDLVVNCLPPVPERKDLVPPFAWAFTGQDPTTRSATYRLPITMCSSTLYLLYIHCLPGLVGGEHISHLVSWKDFPYTCHTAIQFT